MQNVNIVYTCTMACAFLATLSCLLLKTTIRVNYLLLVAYSVIAGVLQITQQILGTYFYIALEDNYNYHISYNHNL